MFSFYTLKFGLDRYDYVYVNLYIKNTFNHFDLFYIESISHSYSYSFMYFDFQGTLYKTKWMKIKVKDTFIHV